MQVVAGAQEATSVGHLWLTDFRCFPHVDIELTPGLTVLYGANGQGKSSLLEAITWVARTRSFRGVSDALLVRASTTEAVVRAEVVTGERRQLFEAEIRATGRNRIMCNKQAVSRARDLHGLLRVTVFAPDDLALVKGGPAERRDYLDDLLTMLSPRYDAARTDYERVLKQRNALLRGGVRDEEARVTLDVFDDQLVNAAVELVRGRLRLVDRLVPAVRRGYQALAGQESRIDADYEAEWSDGGEIEPSLRAALEAKRKAEIERGLTLVGPHRDEWRLAINQMDSRYQASQGEQRTLALALRLAGHEVVAELTGAVPVLLLDDVFSELDADRAAALVRNLPAGQTLLTTAGEVPAGVEPQRRLYIRAGAVGTRGAVTREPVPLRDALAAVGKQLGVPAPDVAAQLEAVWAEVAGDALAAHARVRLGRGGECAIDVDGPAWATRARYLAETFRDRANEAAGRPLVTGVNVQVKRPGETV